MQIAFKRDRNYKEDPGKIRTFICEDEKLN